MALLVFLEMPSVDQRSKQTYPHLPEFGAKWDIAAHDSFNCIERLAARLGAAETHVQVPLPLADVFRRVGGTGRGPWMYSGGSMSA